jgi:hypothetical protein
MPGVLDPGGGTPPAPLPNAGPQPAVNGVLSAPGASTPQVGLGQPQGQPPAPPPAPTHGQAVAALRHFDAIRTELAAILKDPAIGKSNMKSKIIDGVTKLVANRIMTPGAAVAQLASVPEEPFQQKRWLQTHVVQTVFAEMKVLGDHGRAFGGIPEHLIDKTSSPDDHLSDMQSVMGHYGGRRG